MTTIIYREFWEIADQVQKLKDNTQEMKAIVYWEFWEIADHDEQNAFLLTQIDSKNKEVSKQPKEGAKSKPDSLIRIYHIESLVVFKEVCKDVYNVSNGRLGRLLYLLLIKTQMNFQKTKEESNSKCLKRAKRHQKQHH